ncbi:MULTISPECIES: branched-chain amino acid ABC transporter permease [unclassified Halorubrum]|uniref:branched-chain amino acid ABC transporter permease n=1 Tax=unclassified Halorubrum TaxID=2642239 RepID=UPI000B99A1E1|nr:MULTISPECIES: branched-chain amino acid ABC transporter permease [unclassified Halorubrum]OYR47799.1 branched-chain amino acid ABC transporter permease [Halorubrum sp. Hd13]OYR48663.1 branched-chain amino acid ABC transporter permease [Halorubrum sp. Ea8]
MSATDIRGRIEGLFERDVTLVLAVLGTLYLAYILAGVAFGYGLRGQLNSVANLTFYIGVFGMLALALNLHWGYTGLFNIGIVGFMGIGIYVTALVSKPPVAEGGAAQVGGFGLPLSVGIAAGVIAAGLFGLLVALPALRLRADYLAIVTVAFSEIVRFTMMSRTFQTFTVPDTIDLWLFTFDPTADTVGLGGGGGLILNYADPLEALLRSLFLWEPYLGVVAFVERNYIPNNPKPVIDGVAYGILLLVGVGLFYVLLSRTGKSPFGRVLKAIREDEDVANALGKDTDRFKLTAFVLGSALMGLGGILWYSSRGSITPPSFRPNITFFIWIALIIGGAGSNTGSFLGGAIFAGLLYEGPRYFKNLVETAFELGDAPRNFGEAMAGFASLDPMPFVLYTLDSVSQLRLVIMGVVLIWLMHNRPEGLLGHRKETASSVDLARPGTDEAPGKPAAADGGEER